MRFQIRDLLSLTTLFAIYLCGCLYAAQQLRPGELAENGWISVFTFAFHIAVYKWVYLARRRANAPYDLRLEGRIPWRCLLAGGALLWILAVASPWLLDGTFFVLSIPFITLVGMAIIHRHAHGNENGLFYLGFFAGWKNVKTSSTSKQLSLALGPPWLNLTVKVPSECRQQVIELSNHHTR